MIDLLDQIAARFLPGGFRFLISVYNWRQMGIRIQGQCLMLVNFAEKHP